MAKIVNGYTKDELTSLLGIRVNQQKMLNNTLCNLLENNGSSKAIDDIKREIDNVIKEISEINNDLSSFDSDEEVTYSFYDSIRKPNDEDNSVKLNKCENKDCESILNGGISKDFMNEFRNAIDTKTIQSNRFLVDLMDSLYIPSVMVKAVSFDPSYNAVCLCIYDFVADINGNKFPIMEILKLKATPFDFTIRHLDSVGNVVYTEAYNDCVIDMICRDPIDYSSDDCSKIQVYVKYKNVKYEASN